MNDDGGRYVHDNFTVRFKGDMVPAMLHALGIARNTAMMCGSRAVKAEFDAMYADVARQVGIPDLMRSVDEYQWFEACKALSRASTFRWYHRKGHSWGNSVDAGSVSLLVDGREVTLAHGLRGDEPHLDAIKELLERYAGVATEKLPDVSDWREPARWQQEVGHTHDDVLAPVPGR